ncbi:ATP-binding cassette domain-containing protein [Gordonia crocea]|uniref:Putative ABC transporter ATP-binding protein n=1 Tax=Gordonia crocea TaxID=589162 RepID=A0A7M3SUE3_9ACTN|nr:ATP-binding cassette domain-containing protein [Gordonia crocea]GED96267.1 putative ABC transporter ATP-binding protein [Gordonia crocea]
MSTHTARVGEPARSRHRGPLRPHEVALAAVLGGLSVATVVVAQVLPILTSVALLAPVPMALLGQRTRPRALVAVVVAAAGVSFALAGLSAAVSVVGAGVVGGLVGEMKRRGRGLAAFSAVSVLVAPIMGGLSVVVFWILTPLRRLLLESLENTVTGMAKGLDEVGKRLPGGEAVFTQTADGLRALTGAIVDYWWLWLWSTGTVGTLISLFVAWWLVGGVIDRVRAIPSTDSLDEPGRDLADDALVGPLPVHLRGVGFRYPGASDDALVDVDLRIEPGELVAVVGANGSGKSTVAKILAGRAPSTGEVVRPGDPGLGRPGGTAMVLQRPETQMLGARVADDVVWGLPEGVAVDVDALLAEVGLTGLADRDTADLSGGQQQRLALAAALARDPALLIADEVTSMVDPVGRAELLDVLTTLPARRGLAVVLITHRADEAAAADRIVHLREGRVDPAPPQWLAGVAEPDTEPAAAPVVPISPHRPGETLIELSGISHRYLAGTPWEVTALREVSLRVNRGEGLLIVGGNGSGKSTLAWILAGLTTPTSGTADYEGSPIHKQVGVVKLTFQHARLQLQRPTLGEDIQAAGGVEVGTAEVSRLLDEVGLPREFAARSTDALSGGQMRRGVLAGALAGHPQVIVADEPLAGLDPKARADVVALFGRMRAAGLTLIVISHDLDEIAQVCDRQVELVDGVLVDAAAREAS